MAVRLMMRLALLEDDPGNDHLRVIHNFQTYFKPHVSSSGSLPDIWQSYRSLYTDRGTPRKRILCVNEKWSAFENRQQRTYRSVCQLRSGLKPIYVHENELIICPQFWEHPEKPMENNRDECPTVKRDLTSFNTGPGDYKIVLYQTYFLFAGAGALRLGNNALSADWSTPTSPNICLQEGPRTPLAKIWCEVFFVASMQSRCEDFPVYKRSLSSLGGLGQSGSSQIVYDSSQTHFDSAASELSFGQLSDVEPLVQPQEVQMVRHPSQFASLQIKPPMHDLDAAAPEPTALPEPRASQGVQGSPRS
ncbi:hypothetical protein MMC13_003777 [Lambiella insularis]|nr:hypothetical protein [Lambiella insularis]